MGQGAQKSISVFFPCYNDAGSIGRLVENALSLLPQITKDYEVIVIDDGSTDKSREILKKLAKRRKAVKLVFHEKNKGYGGALKSGFREASKDLIFYTDGDGQYDPKELPILLSLMTDDVNFTNGIKMTRHDPTHRIFLGNIYSFVARWIFWLPVYDVDCDFRLIRRDLIKKLELQSNSGSICIEIVKKAQRAGGKFRQVSVHHYQRAWGQSQFFRPSRLASTFFELARLWIQLMIVDRLRK